MTYRLIGRFNTRQKLMLTKLMVMVTNWRIKIRQTMRTSQCLKEHLRMTSKIKPMMRAVSIWVASAMMIPLMRSQLSKAPPNLMTKASICEAWAKARMMRAVVAAPNKGIHHHLMITSSGERENRRRSVRSRRSKNQLKSRLSFHHNHKLKRKK